MASGQFRFAYLTPNYEATVSFYRDGLELPFVGSWDRSPDDRGTVFAAASGMIEVLALPQGGDAEHLFDERPPQGAFMVIEVEDVELQYRQVMEKGLPIQRELMAQSWGHLSFCVREPNGLTIYFYSRKD